MFLSPDDKEKLHDFEEECVEDYFRYKDYKFQSSSDERIRVINERVENMTMRMDDINQKENSIKLSLQTMDYRMSKLEDVALQTNDTCQSYGPTWPEVSAISVEHLLGVRCTNPA